MNNLDREEALNLITPVIDGEATTEEVRALFAYMKADPEVKQLYEDELAIKLYVKKSCKGVRAPENLYTFAYSVSHHSEFVDKPATKVFSRILPGNYRHNTSYIVASAAAMLLAALMFFTQFGLLSENTSQASIVIEEHAVEHYNQLSTEDFSPETVDNPEDVIRELLGSTDPDSAIPDLQYASFTGVHDAEFTEGFYTPMLSFICDNGHPIYVFTFNMDRLQDDIKLNEEARKLSDQEGSYHITKTNGEDVVSWRKGNIWFTAISQHDGEYFANMLPPQ